MPYLFIILILVQLMHLLYLNIPWLIDEVEYNCSSRTLDEWKARGSVNKFQGVYFVTTGTIYVVSLHT